MNPYDVFFEQNNLNFPGSEVYNHEFNTLPNRDIKINKLARRDLSIITSSEYVSKQILVYLEVCGSDREGTEVLITQLKQLVQEQNGELRVEQNGYQVRYTATMNGFSIEWSGITALVTIEFIASDPLGETVELLSFGSFTHTAAQTTYTGNFTGSGTIEPTINIVINSVTGSGSQELRILNGRTNQGIILTAVWAAGDVIEVNSETMEALINGGSVDFAGLFPTFASGTQIIAIEDTLTTRNMSVGVGYHGKLT